MQPTSEQVAAAVAAEAGRELSAALGKIKHCLGQLTDEQVWWRPAESMNSIANILLHLEGNLRQWIVSGIGRAHDTRNRPSEFAQRGPIAKAELLAHLETAVSEAQAALSRATAADLLRPRRIQGFDVTGVGAIFDSVPHFRGHTQEIIHMTRSQLGTAYRLAWTPTTPEQGIAVDSGGRITLSIGQHFDPHVPVEHRAVGVVGLQGDLAADRMRFSPPCGRGGFSGSL